VQPAGIGNVGPGFLPGDLNSGSETVVAVEEAAGDQMWKFHR
jgi:hypothetical protein